MKNKIVYHTEIYTQTNSDRGLYQWTQISFEYFFSSLEWEIKRYIHIFCKYNGKFLLFCGRVYHVLLIFMLGNRYHTEC